MAQYGKQDSYLQKEVKNWRTATNAAWFVYQYLGKFDVWRLWGQDDKALECMYDLINFALEEPHNSDGELLKLKEKSEFCEVAKDYLKFFAADLVYCSNPADLTKENQEKYGGMLELTPSFLQLQPSFNFQQRLNLGDASTTKDDFLEVFLEYGFDKLEKEKIVNIANLDRRTWGTFKLKNRAALYPLLPNLANAFRYAIKDKVDDKSSPFLATAQGGDEEY